MNDSTFYTENNRDILMRLRFLVTGGAGFIGSNLVESLTQFGEVIVIDDLSTGNIENIKPLMKNQPIIVFIKHSKTSQSTKALIET